MVHDDDLAATLDGLAAQALEYLGDHEEVWKRRARALRLNALVHNDVRKAVTLTAAANLQLAARNWAAANALLDYALPLAEAARDSLVTGQIRAERSIAREESGDHVGAAHDRDAASRAARKVVALEVRERLLGFVNIAKGVAQRSASPSAAIAYFGRTIDHQKRSSQSSLLPRLYYERARARAALGDHAGERDDLRAGLDVIDSWERSIGTPEQRAAITVWGEAMRRDLISVDLAGGDVAAAFAVSDTRPEPLISPTAHSAAVKPDVLRNLRAALASDAAVVELVRIREKFIVFVVRNGVATAITLPSRASRIAVTARALRDAADDHFPTAAAELYTMVIAPLRHYLEGVRTIAFIPDHDLTGLSLGSLLDRETNRYLGEDFIIVHAPTAAAAISMSREARVRTGQNAVVIGANEFDRAKHPELDQLLNVAGEAKDIASVWPSALILTGAQVTSESLERQLPQAAIVHFAGHITGHGANSRLIAVGNGLSARDVARMRFDATRVVILAACRSSANHDSPVLYA
ncbi:MAG TPA: CHAT domain-containing protein, partial [Thermoanaerobaculia bacterium]|nr:CHAT domain-containing protein [Thermoanaerobaculia bacterium]